MIELKPAEKMAKTEFQVVLGEYTDIISLDIPTRVNTGEDINWNFVTHLRVAPPTTWTNLAVGIQYVDGPQDKITVDSFELSKGGVAASTTSIPSTCTTVKLNGTVKALNTAGSYKLRFLAGHAEAGTFYADSSLESYLTATTPPAPAPAATAIDVSAIMNMMMSILMLFMMISIMASLMRMMRGAS